MSAKTFDGAVSIVLNTKGEIALKRNPDGKFSQENAKECYTEMLAQAKKRKASINKYSLFIPEGGIEPVLLANRYGNPYLALLKPQTESERKSKVQILA